VPMPPVRGFFIGWLSVCLASSAGGRMRSLRLRANRAAGSRPLAAAAKIMVLSRCLGIFRSATSGPQGRLAAGRLGRPLGGVSAANWPREKTNTATPLG